MRASRRIARIDDAGRTGPVGRSLSEKPAHDRRTRRRETSGATPVEKRVGDFFASGRDEAAINAAGITPLQPELDGLKAIKTPAAGLTALARLQSFGVGVGFRRGSSPDLKQSERERAVLGQGGRGFPERGYSFNDDKKSLKIRHIGRLEAPWGDARKGDPEAAVRVADGEMAAGRGRPVVAVNAAEGGDECVARV